MLYYDYLLTFEGEVRFFWKRKVNLVTILFFVTRYTALLGNIPLFLKYFGNWESSVRSLPCFVSFGKLNLQIL